jgi:hypothetical protein
MPRIPRTQSILKYALDNNIYGDPVVYISQHAGEPCFACAVGLVALMNGITVEEYTNSGFSIRDLLEEKGFNDAQIRKLKEMERSFMSAAYGHTNDPLWSGLREAKQTIYDYWNNQGAEE